MPRLTTALLVIALAAFTRLVQEGDFRPALAAAAPISDADSKSKNVSKSETPAAGPPAKASAKAGSWEAQLERIKDDHPSFIIATVPDPKLTRLGLQFDRFVDTVQRAAESRAYRFEWQWLPWTAEAAEYTKPGILMFQCGDEHLAILLVGESPSAGVTKSQFDQAMKLASGQATLKVLGPSFSGGFHSLKNILKGRGNVEIHGGEASSTSAIADFKKAFPYQSYIPSSKQASEYFESYRESRSVSIPEAIVELDEAGTEYGASSPIAGAVSISFPRDLSVLRKAYESDPKLASTLSPQTAEGASVQLRKADEAASGDTVPVQTPSATAATDELQLQTAARTIHEHRYLLGSIQATNVLDTLFLRQYMAAHAPDTQFVLFEPDVLFLHAPESNSFQGSFAVSRYPMLSAPGNNNPKFYPSNSSAGLYRAAQSLIVRPKSALPDPDPDPNESCDDPAKPCELWITMIGLNGYWPVACSIQKTDDPNKPDRDFKIRVPSVYGAICLTIVLAIWVMILALLKAKVTRTQPKPKHWHQRWSWTAGHAAGWAPKRWYADFVFDPAAPFSYARRYHAFTVVIAASVLISVLYWPLVEMGSPLATVVKLVLIPTVVGVILTWPFGKRNSLATVPLADATRRKGQCIWYNEAKANRDEQRTPWMAIGVIVGGGVPFALLHCVVWRSTDNGWNQFAAYRSMFFGNGVNPTLPLFFAALSVAACAWYHFQRFISASERFVPLSLTQYPDLQGPYEGVRDVLAKYCTLPAGISAASIIALMLTLTLSHHSAFTIEGAVYDWTFIVVLIISASFSMLSVCQFLQAWRHLSDFLKALAGLPIQGVFHDLPRDLGSVALFQSSPRQRTYLFATRCRDLLLKIEGPRKDIVVQIDTAKVEEAVGKLLSRAGKDERETAEEAFNAQRALYDAQDAVLKVLHQEFWSKGQSELVPEKDKPEGRLAAEEFLALRLVAFIRYSTIQLRNLLSFFSVSFILQTMAVSSYPFFTQSLSRMHILCAFTVMFGAGGYVLVGMARDQVLSNLATDHKGSDSPILWQSVQSASLPLLAFVSTYFPDLGRTLFSWLIPMLNSAK